MPTRDRGSISDLCNPRAGARGYNDVVKQSAEAEAESTPARAFFIERVAGPEEIDELGHVSNLSYVRWVQEVAVAHSESAGYDAASYADIGAIFVVRRHEIDYLVPAYAGDRVRIATWVESWRGASASRRTRIERARDGRALAQARTLWVFVNQESGRPVRIPREMAERFGASP